MLLGIALVFGLSTACSDNTDSDDRACDTEPSFVGIDYVGIWHFEAVYDAFGVGTATFRIYHDGTQLQAVVGGVDASELTLDQRGMHVVTVTDTTADGGVLRTRDYRLCSMDADGTATGTYRLCIDEDCFDAALTGGKVEPLDEPMSSGITLISEYNGEDDAWFSNSLTVNVRVHGDMAYLARRFDGLRVVDISDPVHPVERGHAPTEYPDAEHYNDVKMVQGPNARIYALMASNVRGVVVIDVTDPDAPTDVTTFPDASLAPDGVPSVHTLFVEDERAYIAYNYDQSLQIYDVSNPADPQPLGSFSNPRLSGTEQGSLHDLYVEGGRAYLNYWGLGMTVVDTQNDPENPVLVGEFDDYGHDTSHSNWVTHVGDRSISVHGDEQYGAHVRIVDVDPESDAFMTEIGRYQTRPQVSVHNILAHEDRAYVTYYQDGLRVLDLSDPTNPTLIAHYHTWPGPDIGYGFGFYEGAIGVDYDPDSQIVYLADTHRGLLILSMD